MHATRRAGADARTTLGTGAEHANHAQERRRLRRVPKAEPPGNVPEAGARVLVLLTLGRPRVRVLHAGTLAGGGPTLGDATKETPRHVRGAAVSRGDFAEERRDIRRFLLVHNLLLLGGGGGEGGGGGVGVGVRVVGVRGGFIRAGRHGRGGGHGDRLGERRLHRRFASERRHRQFLVQADERNPLRLFLRRLRRGERGGGVARLLLATTLLERRARLSLQLPPTLPRRLLPGVLPRVRGIVAAGEIHPIGLGAGRLAR